MNKIPIAVIGGATASGKSGLAAELALRLGGEVVSADSMQIYKYMDIGSAKPTAEEMRGVPHHMIDVADPRTDYSVADYAKAAHEVIADIYARGRLPVMCGGTGLYISSVINDVDFIENDGDPYVRAELFRYAEENGSTALHERLRGCDPSAAAAIHENNVKRVVRALEFYTVTGSRISEHQAHTREKESRYRCVMMRIEHERSALYERINKRVDIMIEAGLEREVRTLMDMGVDRSNTSMQAIGYKEIARCICGECTLEEAVDEVKTATRRYAKRQLTWFRRYENMLLLPYGEDMLNMACDAVRQLVQDI